MKRKHLSSVLIAACLFASCESTQKQDEKKAEQKTEESATLADVSAVQQNASEANAANAAVLAVQASIDNAMSKVAVPVFKKENAKRLAESFHKYVSELVNANSGEKAVKYSDKLVALKNDYNKKVAEEKLDAKDKQALDKYVEDLIAAIQSVQ